MSLTQSRPVVRWRKPPDAGGAGTDYRSHCSPAVSGVSGIRIGRARRVPRGGGGRSAWSRAAGCRCPRRRARCGVSVARVERLLEADADRRCVVRVRRLGGEHGAAASVARRSSAARAWPDGRRVGAADGHLAGAGGALAGAAGDRAEDRPARAHVSGAAVGARERRDRRAVGACARLRPVRGRRMLSPVATQPSGRHRPAVSQWSVCGARGCRTRNRHSEVIACS